MSHKLLIVDDEEDMLMAMEMRMKSLGYDVVTAANGDEAIQRFADEGADLVLLDVMMPGKDGFQVCREIKGQGNGKVKVVIFTGKMEGVNTARAREVGADDFIVKTSDLKYILESIRELLS